MLMLSPGLGESRPDTARHRPWQFANNSRWYAWYASDTLRTMPVSLFPTDDELQEVLVGPDSVSWSVASDIRLYAVMLYPLLLQVAHPTVGRRRA